MFKKLYNLLHHTQKWNKKKIHKKILKYKKKHWRFRKFQLCTHLWALLFNFCNYKKWKNKKMLLKFKSLIRYEETKISSYYGVCARWQNFVYFELIYCTLYCEIEVEKTKTWNRKQKILKYNTDWPWHWHCCAFVVVP